MNMGIYLMMRIHYCLDEIKMVLIIMATLFALDMSYRMGFLHAIGRMLQNIGSYAHLSMLRVYYRIFGYPCDCCKCKRICACGCGCECHLE